MLNYIGIGRGDLFPLRLDRFAIGAHDLFFFVRGLLGFEVWVVVLVFYPNCIDLPKQFGHAVANRYVVDLAKLHLR